MKHYELLDSDGHLLTWIERSGELYHTYQAVLPEGEVTCTAYSRLLWITGDLVQPMKLLVKGKGPLLLFDGERMSITFNSLLPVCLPSGAHTLLIITISSLPIPDAMLSNHLPSMDLLRSFLIDLRIRGLIQEVRTAPNGLYLQLKQDELSLAAMSRITLEETVNELSGPMAQKAHQAAAYLQAHLSNAPTLKEVARAVMSNRSCLQEAFKQVYHTTIARYSQELRLLHVRELLLNPGLSLDDIADETGYYDGAYLSKVFKQHYGVGPREWRREMRIL